MTEAHQRIWLCWSPRQNCFHIESEEDGARTNYEAFSRNAGTDYIPIAVFFTHDQASKAAAKLRPVLSRREKLFGNPAENSEN